MRLLDDSTSLGHERSKNLRLRLAPQIAQCASSDKALGCMLITTLPHPSALPLSFSPRMPPPLPPPLAPPLGAGRTGGPGGGTGGGGKGGKVAAGGADCPPPATRLPAGGAGPSGGRASWTALRRRRRCSTLSRSAASTSSSSTSKSQPTSSSEASPQKTCAEFGEFHVATPLRHVKFAKRVTLCQKQAPPLKARNHRRMEPNSNAKVIQKVQLN